MNIFRVLSSGNSRLREVSMSAMLGYLLSPSEDHGLGDTFLRGFLNYVEKSTDESIGWPDYIKNQRINAVVELEKCLNHMGSTSSLDISISILDENQDQELIRLVIENKIKVSSFMEGQLTRYYNETKADLTQEGSNSQVIFIYLTPDKTSEKLVDEFSSLSVSQDDRKSWLIWAEHNSIEDKKCVASLIKNILADEVIGDIQPINEYMRHTLKGFLRHLYTLNPEKSSVTQRGQDIGDIVASETLTFDDGRRYQITRRSSSQIQLYKLPDKEPQSARPLMVDYINEKKLDIGYSSMSNTRSIGRDLIKALRS